MTTFFTPAFWRHPLTRQSPSYRRRAPGRPSSGLPGTKPVAITKASLPLSAAAMSSTDIATTSSFANLTPFVSTASTFWTMAPRTTVLASQASSRLSSCRARRQPRSRPWRRGVPALCVRSGPWRRPRRRWRRRCKAGGARVVARPAAPNLSAFRRSSVEGLNAAAVESSARRASLCTACGGSWLQRRVLGVVQQRALDVFALLFSLWLQLSLVRLVVLLSGERS